MNEINGGPAFPSDERLYGSDGTVLQILEHRGMTLRDWFAGQALAGSLADPVFSSSFTPEKVAEFAYKQADAMLAARGG